MVTLIETGVTHPFENAFYLNPQSLVTQNLHFWEPHALQSEHTDITRPFENTFYRNSHADVAQLQ